MKMLLTSRGAIATLLIALFLLATNTGAQACAACWGDTSGSKMANAAAIGIFAMVVIMFVMLGTIAAFGWHLAWRAKNPLPDYDELLAEEPTADPGSNPGTKS